MAKKIQVNNMKIYKIKTISKIKSKMTILNKIKNYKEKFKNNKNKIP